MDSRGWRLFVSIAILAVSGQVRAGPLTIPLGGEPPTTGVRLPAPTLAGGDAAAVEINPGAVGLLERWSVLVHHAELRKKGRITGGGDALLAATPVPYLDFLAVGAGVQWLRPASAIGYDESVKLSLALAYRYRRSLSIGLGYHVFVCDRDPNLDGLQSLDLGLAVHPLQWLGGGVVIRNLNTPVYAGVPLQREYDLEVMLRPLLSDRLEIGAGLKIGERRGDFDPHFRVAGEPLSGLRVFSRVELVNRDFYRDGDSITDVRMTVGLGVNLERVGIAVSAEIGRGLDQGQGPLRDPETGAAFQGAGITLRLQGQRRQPLFDIDKQILTVSLRGEVSQRRWLSLIAALHQVERRDDLVGVFLEIDGLSNGWAMIQELRRWLRRLRKAGKKSMAYVRAPGIREYYLAAAADRVLLDPAGDVQFKGLAMQSMYFKGLLDKIGVSPQFVRIAEYKSAPESYTNSTASGPARKMRAAILDDMFVKMLSDIAADRKRSVSRLRKLIDRGPFNPPRALASGLVDQIIAPHKVRPMVEQHLGARLVKPAELKRSPGRWPVGPGIAVIVVEGDIVRGNSMSIPLLDRKLVGDDTVAKALAWARASEDVKAIVLRINSPGGSAMASDRMWREAARAQKAKPLVVSMGDMATSGGYYLAAAADQIFAEPATITGSIGIFSGKVDLSGLLTRLGITIDTEARGKTATLNSYDRPYTPAERKSILARLQHRYRAFLKAVGRGRKMTTKQVHQVARGRVWTGNQARKKGLVDRFGGLTEAIEDAKRRAGLALDRPVGMFLLPVVKKSLLGRLLSLVGLGAAKTPLPTVVVEALKGVMPVLFRARSGEALARLPYHLTIN